MGHFFNSRPQMRADLRSHSSLRRLSAKQQLGHPAYPLLCQWRIGSLAHCSTQRYTPCHSGDMFYVQLEIRSQLSQSSSSVKLSMVLMPPKESRQGMTVGRHLYGQGHERRWMESPWNILKESCRLVFWERRPEDQTDTQWLIILYIYRPVLNSHLLSGNGWGLMTSRSCGRNYVVCETKAMNSPVIWHL